LKIQNHCWPRSSSMVCCTSLSPLPVPAVQWMSSMNIMDSVCSCNNLTRIFSFLQ
jgi:hypothetical protein